MESTENENESIQTVEIIKQPGQTLGFYIREGNGVDRTSGVFISRIANGSVVARNGLLRVNDEILSVNSVNVTHMSLDDVVILMSIAKCLVLTVRFQQPHTVNAIVSNAEEQDQDAGIGRNQQPVVVLKSGFANSFSGMTIEDRSPDDLTVVDSARYGHRTLPSQTMYGTGMRNGRFRSPGNSGSDPMLDPYFHQKGMHDLQRSGKALLEQGTSGLSRMMYGDPPGRAYDSYPGLEYDPQSFEKVIRTGSGKHVYSSPRASQRHLDYASDTDVTYHPCRTPFEQLMSRCNPYKGGSLNSGHGFPDRATRSHNGGVPSHYINGNEQYSSDSEIMTHYHRSSRGAGRMTSRPSGDQQLSRRVEGSEIFYSLPHKGRDEYRDYQHQLSLQSDLSHRGHVSQPKPADSFVDVHAGYYTEMAPARKGTSGCKMPVSSSLSSDEYTAWLSHQSSPVNTTSPSRGLNVTNHRLTRKMSTDSLLDYKTYQMDDPGTVYSYSDAKRSKDVVYASDLQRRVKDNQQSVASSYVPLSTMTLSRAQHGMAKNAPASALMSSMSLSASESSRAKGVQLARMPLKIQTETFHACPSGEGTLSDDAPGLSGLLFVRVFCGHGLKSSRTALRDLYCVIEVNSTNKARTMIRTGAINFDWDEEFEIDIEDARRLAFLIYSWDPHTRHTLCFTGVLSLATVLRQVRYQRLAMKLEPKGTLYVELNYTESSVALLRKPSIRRNGVFGVDLKTLVLRQNSGYGVPIIVIRCVEEVERRGLDHVGLYRLCGSSRRKQQLKEEVERNVQAADLSIEAVTDINVITCVLKDFLRELPEPLCSNALYQMLLDALSVQVPGDHEGNTQLMLGILECLPRVNQETLAYLLNHLKRVALKSDVNKMTTLNLAICLGPALVCPSTDDCDQATTGASVSVSPQTMNFNKQIELLKYLLDIWHENQNLPKNSNSEGGMVGPPHPSSKSPRNKRFPERSLSDSNGGRKQNQQQEREEALAWENAETSPC